MSAKCTTMTHTHTVKPVKTEQWWVCGHVCRPANAAAGWARGLKLGAVVHGCGLIGICRAARRCGSPRVRAAQSGSHRCVCWCASPPPQVNIQFRQLHGEAFMLDVAADTTGAQLRALIAVGDPPTQLVVGLPKTVHGVASAAHPPRTTCAVDVSGFVFRRI